MNFARILVSEQFKRNAGRHWRIAVATTNSDGGMPPVGHFKFPHLWPVKFLQAGRANYQSFDVSRAMRAAALEHEPVVA